MWGFCLWFPYPSMEEKIPHLSLQLAVCSPVVTQVLFQVKTEAAYRCYPCIKIKGEGPTMVVGVAQ